MKRSKLEIYYQEQFGGPDLPDDAPDEGRTSRPVRRGPARRRARRRFGVVRILKLTLTLGPMAILLGATLLMDCQKSAQMSWAPDILRGTACARRDLAGRAFAIDGNLRTIASSIR